MFSKELSLKARVTKNKIINLTTKTINVTKTCSNAAEMERKALARVIDTAENNNAIALESLLVKKMSKECLILFNADDSMRITTKGKLL